VKRVLERFETAWFAFLRSFPVPCHDCRRLVPLRDVARVDGSATKEFCNQCARKRAGGEPE
jgi:hypothetical protein